MRCEKHTPWQIVARLFAKKDGTTAIEFALIAPVFFLLLMGTIELGLILFAESVLQGSLTHGARISKTGYSEGDRVVYIKNEIIRLSGFILDPNELVVESLNYDSHANIGQPEPCITALCENGIANIDYRDINGNNQWDADQGVSGPGIRNRIVIYRASYTWPIFTPIMGHVFGNSTGEYRFSSTAIVKNEAF